MNMSSAGFFTSTPDRAAAIAAGFRFGHIGTHTSRTMMLDELATTFVSVAATGKPADYSAAIVDENCLGKATVSTRRSTLQRLRELYALDPAVPIFRILRRLWDLDTTGRPLLALLICLARDPLLLATANVIESLTEGAEFQRQAMKDALARLAGERFNEATLNKVIRNCASSWSQSGHLEGRTFKFRRRVSPTSASAAFAFYLARAAGFGTEESLRSGWVRVLDCSASSALELAGTGKRLGLLDLQVAGNVVELNLKRLDPRFQMSSQGEVKYGTH
jgi:hypothetical protein